MSIGQDFVQVQEMPVVLSRPLLEIQDSPSFAQHSSSHEDSSASSARHLSSPSPVTHEEASSDNDVREPLKEVTKSVKANQETPDQEQEEESEESNENNDKLNDYVAKVLEKLVKQRNKMARLSAVLEKKGLLPDKKTSQVQNMAQELEELAVEADDNDAEEENVEGASKENLSPIKTKQGTKSDVLAQIQEAKDALAIPAKKSAPKYTVEDVIQVSRREIYYGARFPGQIVEEHLDIINKSGHDFVVQIFVSCVNEELQNTDEYVYSVRRSHLYDYNDKHYLIMAPYSCAAFKFALKVPNLKISGKIQGQVKIGVQGLSGSYMLNLSADVSIPRIHCPKELRFNGLDYSVIKLAIREGKKQECKIPIRNNGDVPVTLELEFYDPKDSRETQERPMFDCMVHPNVITIAPNSATLTSVLVKPWKALMAMKGLERPKPARKILIGRVRDSALIYSFVFWIEIHS